MVEREVSELAFDPQSGAQPPLSFSHAAAADAPDVPIYGVGQIAGYLRELVDTDPVLNDLWVGGEVTNLSRSQAGHIYFTLTDEEGALRCAFFRRENAGTQVEQGEEVLVHGRVSLYLQRGDLQLYVDSLQPRGMGVLHAEFLRLVKQLEAEGLFADQRKRSLPRYPRRIAVVTSASGSVWHDIQTVLARRWPLATLQLAPCRVQGEGAARTIANAIHAANHQTRERTPEVIIVARGGGSLEDLWAFNEERVARAIFASEIPVISAVGHETDFTVADYVADVRAATPSAAAEIVAPERGEERARIHELRETLGWRLERVAASARSGFDGILQRLERARPDLDTERLRIDGRLRDGEAALLRAFTGRSTSAAALRGRLAGLNPLATLERGYAIVQGSGGRVITDAGALQEGDAVSLRLRRGRAEAEITATTTSNEETG